MPKTIAQHLAIGYIRLSPRDEEDKTGLGPAAQRAAMEEFAKSHGLVVPFFFEDLDVSGKMPLEKRPGLLHALVAIKEHRAGKLLIHKRDRLSRNTLNAGLIEQAVERLGAVVWSATGSSNDRTPEAKLMRHIQDGFAEFEREQTRARTRAALAIKKSQGLCVGEPPYGYRAVPDAAKELKRGRLELVPEEQRVISIMVSLRLKKWSVQMIADHLNAEGILPRRFERKLHQGGGTWHRTSIDRILKRALPRPSP